MACAFVQYTADATGRQMLLLGIKVIVFQT